MTPRKRTCILLDILLAIARALGSPPADSKPAAPGSGTFHIVCAFAKTVGSSDRDQSGPSQLSMARKLPIHRRLANRVTSAGAIETGMRI